MSIHLMSCLGPLQFYHCQMHFIMFGLEKILKQSIKLGKKKFRYVEIDKVLKLPNFLKYSILKIIFIYISSCYSMKL